MKLLELNAWTSTNITESSWDAGAGNWKVTLDRMYDGKKETRVFHPRVRSPILRKHLLLTKIAYHSSHRPQRRTKLSFSPQGSIFLHRGPPSPLLEIHRRSALSRTKQTSDSRRMLQLRPRHCPRLLRKRIFSHPDPALHNLRNLHRNQPPSHVSTLRRRWASNRGCRSAILQYPECGCEEVECRYDEGPE